MESRQRNRVNKLIALIVEAILEEVDEEICVIKKRSYGYENGSIEEIY
nr:unnamed protein product [Callosobruchus analis]CAI5834300.1 unnamed protein product [Callosobruchus analis]CAI5857643.1 unnamed protein product [Callosobruchus analis]